MQEDKSVYNISNLNRNKKSTRSTNYNLLNSLLINMETSIDNLISIMVVLVLIILFNAYLTYSVTASIGVMNENMLQLQMTIDDHHFKQTQFTPRST